jgi:hypothetical protein
MLAANKQSKTVRTVLKIDMVFDGERAQKGDVVDMSAREFRYLAHHDRVAEATPENIAAVKAQIKSEKDAAERAKMPSETEVLRQRVAELQAKLDATEKGK